jgi:hypothetical protein
VCVGQVAARWYRCSVVRGFAWLVLASACWTGASEPVDPRAKANDVAGHVTCEEYWAHVDDIFDIPEDVRTSLPPLTPEDCAEYERFTEEQRQCVVSSTMRETLVLCAIQDPQQRAEARTMSPMVKRAWPGTATPEAVRGEPWRRRDPTKGCAFLGIDAREHWRTKAGVSVGFLLRDDVVLPDPKLVTATIAPSTWTCIATEPAGMCDELQRRCGPNASPE